MNLKNLKPWLRYELPYQVSKRREKLMTAIVWRLPKWIIYWSTIRAGAHATTGKYGNTIVPEVRFIDVLERYGKDMRAAR